MSKLNIGDKVKSNHTEFRGTVTDERMVPAQEAIQSRRQLQVTGKAPGWDVDVTVWFDETRVAKID